MTLIMTLKTMTQSSYIKLPNKGKEGEKVTRSLDKSLSKLLLGDDETKHVYTSTKLSIRFQIKGKSKQQPKHDMMYYVKCPESTDDYISEIAETNMKEFWILVRKAKNCTY